MQIGFRRTKGSQNSGELGKMHSKDAALPTEEAVRAACEFKEETAKASIGAMEEANV